MLSDVPGAFDADAYFNSLASTASLPDLLRRENELLNGEFGTVGTGAGSEKL